MKTKKLIYTFLLCSFIGFNTSCETTDLDGTIDPDAVSTDQADATFLFNNIQFSFNNLVQGAGGIGSFTSQVTRSFAMTGSSVYQSSFSPGSFNGIWSTAYAGLLQDIKALEVLAGDDNPYTYHIGVSKVMKAYTLFTLVDMFGNVPYSQSLLGLDNDNPQADSETDVYTAALQELDDAIVMLQTPSRILPENDFYYEKNGVVSTDLQAYWITAAKSIKLRVLNNVRLNGSALGLNVSAEIETLLTENDLIDTPAEDLEFIYGTSRLNPNTRHPSYNSFYEVSAGGYLSNYLMWSMLSEGEKGFDDPRLPYYFYRQDGNANGENIFTLGCQVQSAPGHYSSVNSIYNSSVNVPFCVASFGRGYWGRDHGDNNGIPPDDEKRTVPGVYPAGGSLDINDPDSAQNEGSTGFLGAGITPILLSSHVSFIKAEASLTLGTTGSASANLEAAIRQSMDKTITFLGAGTVNSTAVQSYVDFVLNEFNASSPARQLDILMKELYIASFGNSLEVYNAYRRTGLPSNLQPTIEPNPGDFYRSAYYPSDYVNNNVNANSKELTQQIFWDTNPAGFIN